MSSTESLEDLKITKDEFDRITDAMKNEEFRKLFVEYCEEISDPENRKKYEAEIQQLESQRGVECKFVHPHPGFVVKTTNGVEKVFINIAKNDLVDCPSCENAVGPDGKMGQNWSLPLIQAPVRKDMDKKNQWCCVYDVIFHPETLEIAEKSGNFRQMVVQTAIDAVMNAYNVTLDKTNLRFPKMEYKGMAKPTVIRKKSEENENKVDMGPLTDIMPPLPTKKEKIVHKVTEETKIPDYTEPKYELKYRKKLEMHEFTGQVDAKINSSVPNEIFIEIHLPLLRSAGEAVLDVSRNKMSLCSESPAKYRLEIKLSYDVDEKGGNACFNKEKRVLSVTLPIIAKNIGVTDIEKERKPKIEVLSETETKENVVKKEENHDSEPFFDQNITYETPVFSIASFDGPKVKILIEVLNVSNVSVAEKIIDGQYYVRFESLGSGYFPINFGTIINFDTLDVISSIFSVIEGQLVLELVLNGDVGANQSLFTGFPGTEMNRFRLKDILDTEKGEKIKTVKILQEPEPQTIEFESIKSMKLQK